MKKTYYIFALLIFNFTIAQTKTNNSFTLNGTLKENFNNQYLYLKYEKVKDSCLIVDNQFQFNGKLSQEPTQGIFTLKNKVTSIPAFYLESSNIDIELSIKEIKEKNYFKVEIISVVGTKMILIQNDFKEYFKRKNEEFFNKNLLKKLDSCVSLNPNNEYLVSLIYSLSRSDKFDKNELRKIYSKTNQETQTKFYKTRINQILYKHKFLEYGSLIPTISLPNESNKIYNVSDLKGKWILIDFWASWCAPCIKQLPELKSLYDKYKTENFEIVGISIDQDPEKWLKSIKSNALDWVNLNENKDRYGEISTKFSVQEIPTNFLINPEGKIILKNLSIKELEKFIEQKIK